jgi:hypothetical protein
MGVIIPNLLTEDRVSGAQIVDGSLRFDRSKSQYLTRTPSSSGNRKTFTISIWIKPTTKSETDQHHTIYSAGGTKDNIFNTALGQSTGNLFTFNRDTASGEVTYANVSTAAAHRDPSAWYHFVIAVDTTQSTSTNRIKLYKNGELQVNSSTTFPSQNFDLLFFNAASTAQYIGRFIDNSWWYADFYASQYYFIDGQALDPSYFGYTDALTNTWRPKKYNQLTVLDTYSAGVALTATTYADIGGSNCTITNNGSVTSSSAGTNSFGLTNAADMTGAQRVDINMGNVSSTFFQSAWTLEIFFKTSNTSDGNWFVGTAQDGSTWQTGWAIQYQSGSLQWAYDSPAGGSLKSLGIALSSNTWYFMRVQRTPGSSTALNVWVYSSPTTLVGSFSGTVTDTSTQRFLTFPLMVLHQSVKTNQEEETTGLR